MKNRLTKTFTSIDQSNEINTDINVKSQKISIDDKDLRFSTNLMAGKHHIAGTVFATMDRTNLYAIYK